MVSRPVTMQGTMEEEHSTLHTGYRSVSAYYYISMHSTLMKKPAAAQFSLSPGKYATQHPLQNIYVTPYVIPLRVVCAFIP